MLIFEFLQFMLRLLKLILAASKLALRGFGITSPFLNLGSKLAFELELLLLDVFYVMLELDVLILVLKLPLPILFVLSADDGFLFEIL